MQSTVQASKIT